MKNCVSKLGICIICVLLISCSSKPRLRTITLNFTADPVINSEVLLPIDVIVTPDQAMKDIVKIGPEDWFGHQFRDTLLSDELYTIAISGGGVRVKNIVFEEDISKIIIYADFEDTINREGQQLLINCSDKKKKYEILVREKNLEMKK